MPQPSLSANETERQLQDTVRRERGRLLDFIRRRIPDVDEAEDVLQDVFYELTEAYRLTKPIGRVAAWLFAVARHKISDWYRQPRNGSIRTVSLDAPMYESDDEGSLLLSELMPAHEASATDTLMQNLVMDALAAALDELPFEQRNVFVRHELDGQSFQDMAEELNVSINTLLSRKRYAVLFLRAKLQDLYAEWMTD